jgi:hypothetical protein
LASQARLKMDALSVESASRREVTKDTKVNQPYLTLALSPIEAEREEERKTMTRSESISHLATALANAQAEMPVAVFDATNPFLKSKYASLGSVIQASRPILAKHKLSLVQFPVSDGTDGTDGTHGNSTPPPSLSPAGAERVTGRGEARSTEFIGVESILMHESGEFVSERIVIPLTEEKGKTKVQCAGSTLTYLRRYSWAAILGMYSDEDSDGSTPVQAFTGERLEAGGRRPEVGGPRSESRPALPPPPMKQLQSK